MSMKVVELNISQTRGTIKDPVTEVIIDNLGIVGDAHRGDWSRQITILSTDLINSFAQKHKRKTTSGEFAVNIVISGIDIKQMRTGGRLIINDVILEITQIGKEPHHYDSPLLNEVGYNIIFDVGLFTKVIKGGKIILGDNCSDVQAN